MQNKYARERCPPPDVKILRKKALINHGAECVEGANSSKDVAVTQQYKALDLKAWGEDGTQEFNKQNHTLTPDGQQKPNETVENKKK